MATIHQKIEGERGCGYRKPKGKYLIGGKLGMPCGKLPIPLHLCPCCGAGIKPTRGFSWISNEVIKHAACSTPGCKGCSPFDGSVDRFGLLWIGGKYYKRPEDFIKESHRMGISRRISQVPRELEIGKTWILLAHRECIENPLYNIDAPATKENPEYLPGIFQAFVPTAMEYVVAGDEDEEELDRLEKRGFTLVQVERAPAHGIEYTPTSTESYQGVKINVDEGEE